MILKSVEGYPILDLRIVGYQFLAQIELEAVVEGFDWDANWLIVAGRVTAAFGEAWSFAEPCLTTVESSKLGEWLRLAAGGDSCPTLGFTEPCLTFSVESSEDLVTVCVHFGSEAVPAFQPVALLFRMTHSGLADAANEWINEVSRFPER